MTYPHICRRCFHRFDSVDRTPRECPICKSPDTKRDYSSVKPLYHPTKGDAK